MYSSLIPEEAPEGDLSWGHSAGISLVSHSQGNRIGHCTPGSASWIPGRRELPFLFVPPTTFLPAKPYQWLVVLPQGCVPIS